ncbi:MAG: hypothetical protein RLZ12_781 [Bacillota bacterium]|jgi:hypothetical protein
MEWKQSEQSDFQAQVSKGMGFRLNYSQQAVKVMLNLHIFSF